MAVRPRCRARGQPGCRHRCRHGAGGVPGGLRAGEGWALPKARGAEAAPCPPWQRRCRDAAGASVPAWEASQPPIWSWLKSWSGGIGFGRSAASCFTRVFARRCFLRKWRKSVAAGRWRLSAAPRQGRLRPRSWGCFSSGRHARCLHNNDAARPVLITVLIFISPR